MKKTKNENTKKNWYLFEQNNSGGSFHYTSTLAERVWIEASSLGVANARAEEFGIYFNGCEEGRDCECCGDRWYSAWNNPVENPELDDDHAWIVHPLKGKVRSGGKRLLTRESYSHLNPNGEKTKKGTKR